MEKRESNTRMDIFVWLTYGVSLEEKRDADLEDPREDGENGEERF